MSNEQIEYDGMEVKKLHLTRGDLVIVMKPKYLSHLQFEEKMGHLASDIVNYTGVPTLVIGVMRKWNEIRKIDPEKLASVGLCLKKDVLAYKSDSLEEIEAKLINVQLRLALLNQEEEE